MKIQENSKELMNLAIQRALKQIDFETFGDPVEAEDAVGEFVEILKRQLEREDY